MNYRHFFIISPHPIIYQFADNDLQLFVFARDYDKKHKPQKAAELQIPKYYCLSFTDGLQTEIAKPDHDELRISGQALIQLLLLHGIQNGTDYFDPRKVLKRHFEGNALNSAERYMQEVFARLAGRPDKGGAMATYSVATERAQRTDFWDRAIMPGAYRDKISKP